MEFYDKLINYGVLAMFGVAILVLLVISFLRPDVAMIKNHPWMFLLECLVIGVVPAVTLTIFTYTRKTRIKHIYKWVLILAVKFVALHILFQTCGFYTYFLSE